MDITLTLGHCEAAVWKESLAQYKLTATRNLDHYFVYHHWPIDKEKNKAELMQIANENGLIWLDPGRNIGANQCVNWAISQIGLTEFDNIVFYDPDSCTPDVGWDDALLKVLEDPSIGWACLYHRHSKHEFLKSPPKSTFEINGVRVFETSSPKMVTVAAMKNKFLSTAGGMQGHTTYYGHIESALWSHIVSQKMKWVFLPDYTENETIKLKHICELYSLWKFDHAMAGYPHNFDQYVKDNASAN